MRVVALYRTQCISIKTIQKHSFIFPNAKDDKRFVTKIAVKYNYRKN